LKKHAKPKYVLCFAFGQNGEVISGDSNGNIFIWANGKFGFGKSDTDFQCNLLPQDFIIQGRFFNVNWEGGKYLGGAKVWALCVENDPVPYVQPWSYR
jgi:hypothetical protein